MNNLDICTDHLPGRNAFQEWRRLGRIKFFGGSSSKVGGNSLRNRLTDLFNGIDFDFYPFITSSEY